MRVFFAAIIVFVSSSIAQAERRVALVFGVDSYEYIRPLNNAVNDAHAIAQVLDALDFEVFSEPNRDLKRMRRALDDFTQDAAGADVAFVFFAGHGVEIDRQNMLLPKDASAASLEALQSSSLPLNELREVVAKVAKIGLIVLDACRNDPFASISDPKGRGAMALSLPKTVKVGLGRMGDAQNALFAFSAAPGETASDGEGDNSPFTAALTKYLGTEGLEIRSVLTLVQQEVYDLSDGSQLPYVESGLPSLFFVSQTSGELPEREKLLLAMAGVSQQERLDIERIATDAQMPLAPLYGVLLRRDIRSLGRDERRNKLEEAAKAFRMVREELRSLRSGDEHVTALRRNAEEQLSLGATNTAQSILDKALAIDEAAIGTLQENTTSRKLSLAATRVSKGGTASAALDYTRAILNYKKAIEIFDTLTMEDMPPADQDRHIKALNALGSLNNVVANPLSAKVAYERALSLLEQRALKEPENPEWQLTVSVAQNRLADILFDLNEDEVGLDLLYESSDIRRAIVEANPDDLRLNHYLANMKVLFADYYLHQKRDLLAPMGLLRQALDIRSKIDEHSSEVGDPRAKYEGSLHAPSPSRVDLLRAKYEIYTKLGSVISNITGMNHRLGDEYVNYTTAMDYFNEALIVIDEMGSESSYEIGQNTLKATTSTALGGLLEKLGRHSEALTEYQTALATFQTEAEFDPQNIRRIHAVLSSYRNVGRIQSHLGNNEAGLLALVRSEEIAENLVALDNANIQNRESLWRSRITLAEAQRVRGETQAMLLTLERALPVTEWLDERHPEFFYWHRILMGSYIDNGRNLLANGNTKDAEIVIRKAAEIANKLESELTASDDDGSTVPTNDYKSWQVDLWGLHNNVGLIFKRQGKNAEAFAAYKVGYQHLMNYAKDHPFHSDYRDYFYVSVRLIREVSDKLGEPENAIPYIKDELMFRRSLVEVRKDDNNAKYMLMLTLKSLAELGVSSYEYHKEAYAIAKSLVGIQPDILHSLSEKMRLYDCDAEC